ncbi:hypothetical protein D7X33_09665 [Butyricicoccus sp. 1XD8-22]|nr:hypothetical protein D7X33_09665 [Butyricicoccus sp. 1XD8-22]
MKKRFFAVFCILLMLSGCTASKPEAEAPPEEPAEPVTKQAAIFVPDDQAEYLQGEYITVIADEPLPEQLIAALAEAKVIPEDVEIVDCQYKFVDGKVKLDLNGAFLDALEGSGSAGEAMILYSVVDTFLFNFPMAGSLILTAEGERIETEHGSYGEPFTELQYLRQ